MAKNRQFVLLVGEEQQEREALKQALERDYRLVCVNRGDQALEIAHTRPPDIILLFKNVLGLNRENVCDQLGRDSDTARIPVLIVSDSSHLHDSLLLAPNALDCVEEPIEPEIVKARVRNYLQLKQFREKAPSILPVDALTGLANRRAFEERLALEWSHALRSRMAQSLILADVDDFGGLNREFGFAAGDDCLRRIAASLSGCAKRGIDFIARTGSDEFACLLPETAQLGALQVADQIRCAVRCLAISHPAAFPDDTVTVSLGIATIHPTRRLTPDRLVCLAAELLQSAWSAGRDQIKAGLI